MQALIFSKKGDRFDEQALHRDFVALWNTGRFDDIRIEREPGKEGWIIRFVVVERPVIRSIKYEGNKSVTVSDILDRYKERKVGLVVESQYDPNKIQRARNVLLDLLAERGHQYAKVDPQVRRVPPSSLEITFKVDEGPKVKVGNINIEGNTAFSNQAVIRSMKNLHPFGLPHSILFENLFAKTYDPGKFEEDKSRMQVFYQDHGYFTAHVTDSGVTIRRTGGDGFHIPLIHPNKPGSVADLAITMEEGRKYHLNNITFTGVKFFRTPDALMTPLFGMAKGDIFSTTKLRKGIENMRKLYGDFGYIDFVVEPSFEPIANSDMIDLSLAVDEGKQFFVRRIDFSGNTTTRDKVIRRELLIDEGQIFNNRLWELSILRLNQLGYFEPLKAEEAADIKRDTKTDTVDITLKVKERGKNSIQLNGGVSGIAGSFIGASYSTNNFFGTWRNSQSQLATGHQDTSGAVRFYGAVFVRQANPERLHAIYHALRLQSGARSVGPVGIEPDTAFQFAGPEQSAELYIQRLRRDCICDLSAQTQLCPRRYNLWLRYIEHPNLDHRGGHVFQLHRFPRRGRSQSTERHPHQQDHSFLYLQQREPSHHAHGWQIVFPIYRCRRFWG